MTDKEFRRMSKSDLIHIIKQMKNNEQMYLNEITVLEEKLNAREIQISKYGSLAEACIGLNQVFEHAQAAADLYLAEVTKNNCGFKQEADVIIYNANQQANAIINQAYEQREAIFRDVNAQLAAKRQEFEALTAQFRQIQADFEKVWYAFGAENE